jgi:hypothetical protein
VYVRDTKRRRLRRSDRRSYAACTCVILRRSGICGGSWDGDVLRTHLCLSSQCTDDHVGYDTKDGGYALVIDEDPLLWFATVITNI